jgi:hypothetical protein
MSHLLSNQIFILGYIKRTHLSFTLIHTYNIRTNTKTGLVKDMIVETGIF